MLALSIFANIEIVLMKTIVLICPILSMAISKFLKFKIMIFDIQEEQIYFDSAYTYTHSHNCNFHALKQVKMNWEGLVKHFDLWEFGG